MEEKDFNKTVTELLAKEAFEKISLHEFSETLQMWTEQQLKSKEPPL